MDRDIFAERFRRAAHRAREVAQALVEEALPAQLRFRLQLNASHDGNPLLAGEHLFPADSDPSRQRALSDVDEAGALAAFWRDGWVPEWIDLSVVGESGTATLIGALTCGRFAADDGLLYHRGEGYAPFHVLGPSPPGDHVEGRRFSIYDSVQVWEQYGLQRAAQHAERVRALELCGEAFDDAALARLPAFPNLKVLGLSAADVCGPGLSGLAGFPALETLQLYGLDCARLDVGDAPVLAELRSLIVVPAPASPWGIGHWLARLPQLDWLQLSAPAALFLDGSLPRKMTMVSLSGARLLGEPHLCEETESLSLGFPGMSEAAIEALLAPVRAVETLSLDATAVGDALARGLAGRFDLHRLNVRDTKVTAEGLRGLRAEHPRLRTQPRPPSA